MVTMVTKTLLFLFFSCSLADIQLWDVANLNGLNQFVIKTQTIFSLSFNSYEISIRSHMDHIRTVDVDVIYTKAQ